MLKESVEEFIHRGGEIKKLAITETNYKEQSWSKKARNHVKNRLDTHEQNKKVVTIRKRRAQLIKSQG